MKENNFTRLAHEFARSMKIRNLAGRSIESSIWRLGKFFAFLESLDITHIDQITKEAVIAYQVELYERINKKGLPNTVSYQNGMLSSVKQFTRFLKERDYIVSDPARDIRYAKQPKQLPRSVLTRSEARRIIHAPDTKTTVGYRDRIILEVLVNFARPVCGVINHIAVGIFSDNAIEFCKCLSQ